jgi:hypothetical protein
MRIYTKNDLCAETSDLTNMLPDMLPTLASEDASTAASLTTSGSSSFYFLPAEQLAALHAKVFPHSHPSLGPWSCPCPLHVHLKAFFLLLSHS